MISLSKSYYRLVSDYKFQLLFLRRICSQQKIKRVSHPQTCIETLIIDIKQEFLRNQNLIFNIC